MGVWQVGDTIHIGWPDYGRAPMPYELVEVDDFGSVVRARVQDNNGRQGGFLVMYDCLDQALEQLATDATKVLGFPAVSSHLRPSINGTVLRSFDYEWWPTPQYARRPRLIAQTLADLLAVLRERGDA